MQFISFEKIADKGEVEDASDADDPAVQLERAEQREFEIKKLEQGIARLSEREKTAFPHSHKT